MKIISVDEGANKRREKRGRPNNILIKINGWKIVAGLRKEKQKSKVRKKGKRR